MRFPLHAAGRTGRAAAASILMAVAMLGTRGAAETTTPEAARRASLVIGKTEPFSIRIRAEGDDAKPVASFRAALQKTRGRVRMAPQMADSREGVVEYTEKSGVVAGEPARGEFTVLAVADGYALTSRTITVDSDRAEVAVRLDRGREVSFRLVNDDGSTAPAELESQVVTEPAMRSGVFPRRPSGRGPVIAQQPSGPDSVTARLSDTLGPVYVLAHRAGVLDRFIWGPWPPAGDPSTTASTVEVKLPRTGGVYAVFKDADEPGRAPSFDGCSLALRRVFKTGDTEFSFDVAWADSPTTAVDIEVSGLPPGDYGIVAWARRESIAPTSHTSQLARPRSEVVYMTKEKVTVESGTTKSVGLIYEPAIPRETSAKSE